jgi:hypothetical protein
MTVPGNAVSGQGARPAPKKPAATTAKPGATAKPAAPRPKPPARPNTPTNTPTQRCPLESKPCDVQKLTVRAMVLGDDGKDRTLKTAKRLRGQPISKKVSKEVAAFLDRYDLVIDVVAGYPSKEDSSPDNKVKVQGFTDYHGSTCSRQAHPLITLSPVNLIEEFKATPGGVFWKAKQTDPRLFMARSLQRDTQQHDNKLGAIFDIFTSFWPGAHQKHLAVLAVGCGRRAPGGGAPLTELAALIRIFRSDTWSILIKLPPLGKYTHEREAKKSLRTGEVERSVTSTTAGGFNAVRGSTAHKTTTTAGGAVTRENSGSSFHGSHGEQYTTKRGQGSDGSPTYSSKEQSTHGPGHEFTSGGGASSSKILPDKIKKPSGFLLAIKRNDREVDSAGFKEVLESILKVAELIKDGFESLKRMPQLGWKITFSISVLEGSIEGQWGPKMLDAPIDDRYLPVVTFFNLKINVMLLAVSVELSFGLEAMALGTGVILKIAGTLGCKVPLNVNVVGSHDPFEVKLTPSIECELKVVGYASVIGFSIIDVQVSLTGGITVDGKFVVDPKRGLHLEGAVKRKPIVVKGHLKWPLGAPKPIDPIVVLPGAEIAKL